MRQPHVKIIAGRISVLALYAIFLFSAAGLTAQDRQQVVKFPSLKPSLMEVIESIRSQTDFVFAVNLSQVDIQRRVNISATEQPVAKALDEALSDSAMKYIISGHQIVVMRDEPEAQRNVKNSVPEPHSPKVENFEKAVSEYMSGNPDTQTPVAEIPSVRYDTIRRLIPHDGNYMYGDRKLTPSFGTTSVDFPKAKLPLLKIKTNLLYGGVALAPNLSVEVGLGRRTSLEAMGSWNAWHRKGTAESNRKLAHIVVKPEFRYWLCERFNGHYFGAHAFFWRYNVGSHDIPLLFEKEYRYDGRAVGAGLSYGYYWPWSQRWGMEFNIGAGVAFMKYDRYACDRCQSVERTYTKTYFGPTSAGIKLVFRIK